MRSVSVMMLCACLSVAACSNGSAADRAVQPAPPAPSGQPPSSPPPGADANTTEAGTTDAVAEPASTGVAGLNGDDSFCTELAALAASVSLIGLTDAFGDPIIARELEVVAAATVVGAYDELNQSWPAEIDSERAMFDSVYGGYATRSADAVSAVVASDESLPGRLDVQWRALLARTPIDAPISDLGISGADRPLLETAVQRFLSVAGQRVDDVRLGAPQPISAAFESYVAERCGAVAELLPIDEI